MTLSVPLVPRRGLEERTLSDKTANAACPQTRCAVLPAAALALLVAGALLVRLGDDLSLNSHEALLAGTARNMVEGRPATLKDGSRPNPWLIPNFNGQARLVKPPLPYWLAAGVGRLTGSVNEWTARIPSALTAGGTILVLIALLRRQGLGGASLWAAAALVTTAGFLTYARRSLADMPLTFFVTSCLAAAWVARLADGARRFGWLVLAGASAGLAAMSKGPVILFFLPAPLLVLGCWPRVAPPVTSPLAERPRHRQTLWTVAGLAAALAAFLAVSLPWPLYVYWRVPEALDLWKSQSVDRAAGELGHLEPWYYYLTRLPLLLLPWTYFVAHGALALARRTRGEAGTGLLAAFYGTWFIVSALALTVAAGKQEHYVVCLLYTSPSPRDS